MKIVFVHLGPAAADHLWLNISRLQQEFTNLEIVLVYDSESFVKTNNIPGIYFYKYEPSSDTNMIFDNLAHNIQFRQGFWRYSVERIIAISEYHRTNPNELLFHIESDILILPDIPLRMIEKISTLSWCQFNETHDVASLMVFPNSQESTWLAHELLNYLDLDRTLTDMTALRKIASNNLEKVKYLNSSLAIDIFKGAFDAAPFGMWLNGRDPRNHFGFIRRFLPLPESGLDLQRSRFIFKHERLSYLNEEKIYIPLYNLHVHSKRKSLFGKKWKLFLLLDVLTSRIKFPSSWFSIKAFIALLRDYYSRNRPITMRKIMQGFLFKGTYGNSKS